MDIISFNEAATANGRIEKFIENPDSNSGIVTVPKVIGAGENITIPAGRVAVLPNVQVDGTLNIEGEVFIPTGATFSSVVETEGNQDIDGIKTFIESPIVPTPTTGNQAVNKTYADLKVALADFTGSNQSLTENGYQKLPSGLIIQWGTTTLSSNGGTDIIFPITFPVLCTAAIPVGTVTTDANDAVVNYRNLTKTGVRFNYGTGSQSGPITAKWIAIGY